MAEQKKTEKGRCCCTAKTETAAAGKAEENFEQELGMDEPGANVDADGHCTVPAFAETARLDTGEACLDGLNWPEAGNDVPISSKDGGVKNKAG